MKRLLELLGEKNSSLLFKELLEEIFFFWNVSFEDLRSRTAEVTLLPRREI